MNYLSAAVFLAFFSSGKEETSMALEQKLSNVTGLSDSTEEYLHPAIIDGFVADISEFPFAVRLYVHYGNQIMKCTGQAVNRLLIMTAAHCVFLGGRMIVVTGNADQSDYLKGKNVDKYARYVVKNVYVHPEFNPSKLMHDVAILKLGREFLHPGSGIISPSYDKVTKPMNATIFGWGGTEFDKNNNQLYGKRLKIENCTYKPNIDHTYLCLMERGICHGDSGGGLIIDNYLYGIASFHDISQHFYTLDKHAFFYTALSEEESFVKKCIAENSVDRNSPFSNFIIPPLFTSLISLRTYKASFIS